MKGYSKFIKLLVGNLLIFGAGIVALELLFGAWILHDPVRILNIPRNVSIEYTMDSPYFPQKISLYKRDEWGLRGGYERPSEIDILTIGGSTTEQRYISEGQTWQDVLKDNFASADLDITVINAGVSGQSTFGHIRNFDLWFAHIPGLKPKYILAYVGNNDMFLEVPNSHWDDLGGTSATSLMTEIKDKSALFYLWRTLRGMYLAREHGLSDSVVDFENGTWVSEPARTDYRHVLKERVQTYGNRLSVLIDKIEAFGSTPIIVTQARGDYRFDNGRLVGLAGAQGRAFRGFVDSALGDLDSFPFNGVDHYHILSLFNETTVFVCQQKGAICIDLGNELHFGIGDFYDYVHNTPRGAKKIGDYLYAKLKGDPRFNAWLKANPTNADPKKRAAHFSPGFSYGLG
jgi:lysophospholipase L1-like esterase